jgi:hypothetical protein
MSFGCECMRKIEAATMLLRKSVLGRNRTVAPH